jgi:hypothetical protein
MIIRCCAFRYSRVSTNFNLMWKIPVYVSSGTLMLFYAFRGYAVPAIIMFLHTFVLAMTNYAYINVQVLDLVFETSFERRISIKEGFWLTIITYFFCGRL